MGCGSSSEVAPSKSPAHRTSVNRAKTPRIVVDKAGKAPSESLRKGKAESGSAPAHRPDSRDSMPTPGGSRPASQRSLSVTINNHLAAPLSLDEGRPPDYPILPGRCHLCGDKNHGRTDCRLEGPALCSKCKTSGHLAAHCAAFAKGARH